MPHEHPIDDDEPLAPLPPTEVPPVPGAPPGVEDEGPEGEEPPINPAVMSPE